MANVEVHLEWQGITRRLGLMRRHGSTDRETVTYEYDREWLESGVRFTVDPSIPLTAGVFRPPPGHEMFGTIGDSAPDTWGRTLMRRRERRAAAQESRTIRTLHEIDFLLGVSDETRLGALRFTWEGDRVFQDPQTTAIPSTIQLGNLLGASERIVRGDESDEDLLLIFAPGSSLGGARPKASVVDQHGVLSIAKFPRETDEYSIERWEAIALDLAARAGISVAQHHLTNVDQRPVLLSRRFDRIGGHRVPFVSAMSMTQRRDGERGSYLELLDVMASQGADVTADRRELFRRLVFSVLVSNTDDHLRNHGFLWTGEQGWKLSPAYDLNPTPVDIKPRVLATNIDYDDGNCSMDLVRSVVDEFSLSQVEADTIIGEVATVTGTWRDIAKKVGASNSEIDRMQSAFEHSDFDQALKLATTCSS